MYLVLLVLAALGADVLSPVEPLRQNLMGRLAAPTLFSQRTGARYLLGGDQLGRDVLSYVLHGARASLLVGFVTTLLASVIGLTVGVLAGFRKGWLSTILQRLVEIQMSIPVLALIVALNAMMRPGYATLILSLTIWVWVLFARVAQAVTMKVVQENFIEAAWALGATPWRVMFRHILPNVIPSVLVLWPLSLAQVILIESSLNFLELGLPPSVPSWGQMISYGRDYLEVAWWISVVPGAALAATVLAANVVGEFLRQRVQ